jgi:hypothetical protein
MKIKNALLVMRNRYRISLLVISLFAFSLSCSVTETGNSATANAAATNAANAANAANAEKSNSTGGATIEIDPNGPADIVRVFYKHLRERKFREAIFLTNLRPAVEGLTDTELKDFAVDFEAIAGEVPNEIQINGEIVSGDLATVTAILPGEDDKNELQQIKLRRSGDLWIILSVDESAESRIKKEGKNYFYNLRIETHEEEAKKMLERISKAQLAHSLQNGGVFTDMATLVASGLLPQDITTSESTGYDYAIELFPSKIKYTATATPAVYGKSGKMSYLLQLDQKGISRVTGKDNRGKPLKK